MDRSTSLGPRSLARALSIPLLPLLAAGCVDGFGPEVREIRDVRRVAGVERPPAGAFLRARDRRLPHLWRNETRQREPSAWYQASVELPRAPEEAWAIYLPRFAQSAEVFVNGRWLGSSGRVSPPLSRNWNRPFLATLPPTSLAAGSNTVELRLVVEPTAPAFLAPFYVGPEAALHPAYRVRYFLQISCARYGAVVMAAVALILGFIAFRRSEFAHFRFFAFGCLTWAFASAELFLEEPLVHGRHWQVAAMTAVALSILLFIQSTHRSFGKRRGWLECVLYATLAAIAAALSIVPDAAFESTGLALWSFCFFAGTYLGGQFIFGERPAIPRARALVILGISCLLIGAHDVLLALWFPVEPTVLVAPLLSLIAAFWGAWVVIDYFLGALREAERLNEELEERVARKHAELEANFLRLRELERGRVVSAERERLMREMHDGMGGQLVSALAMAEDGETKPPQIADVLRGALDDMRLVIDSLDPLIDDVPTLLGMIRGRVEPRLRTHGLRFDWRVTDLPPTPRLGPEHFLDILRIAQEAITNVVKHAGATVIRVETAEAANGEGRPGIGISIGDDGRGIDEGTPGPGRGLENMRVRASRLEGSIEIVRAAGAGTTVHLWIPIETGGDTDRSGAPARATGDRPTQ